MGNLSADGSVFWVSGRYDACVYAISTVDGHLIKKIPVGAGPARIDRLAPARPLLPRPHRHPALARRRSSINTYAPRLVVPRTRGVTFGAGISDAFYQSPPSPPQPPPALSKPPPSPRSPSNRSPNALPIRSPATTAPPIAAAFCQNGVR